MSDLKRIVERANELNPSVTIWVVFSLTLQLLIGLSFFFQKSIVFLNDFPEFSKSAGVKKSCRLAMRGILKKKASPALFHSSLLEEMSGREYKFFDFIGDEKIFDVVKNDSKGDCAVILTEERGDRFFVFKFKESDSRKHVYGRIVVRIDEITSSELTKEAL
ncbi:MAG: hypothetical protein OXB88_01090 [Bacteriovoracales bacterium]|nr:hypothetical protein [Bacteriovoracales bacterium]